MKISKKIIYLFLFYLFFAGCGGGKGPQVAVAEPDYDFLQASATVQKQLTMRQQRDMAFLNAKYALKAQTGKEVEAFLTAYLESIGLSNERTIQKLCGYVNMDMTDLYESVEQKDIQILEEQAMTVTVELDKARFETALKAALTSNFQRDRSVWDRFQEQSSQDLLNQSLDVLLRREKD